ncbi:oxidoreductase [Streptomyces lincolnensis]|uniref:Oxidoreductase n=1 Tax=Streptomyces lincolnensis TaxID=1915 RepID=A0A1B1MPD5_STRLN|nr:oxidoreductase [Streptomyces lincolnensis]
MRVLGRDGTVLLDKPDDGTGGRPEVTFADGTTFVTGLLVGAGGAGGAGGAWSRGRPLLSSARPEYAGTSVAETYLFGADTRHPAAAKAVGGGMLIAPSPGADIFAHRESGDTLHAYVSLSRPLDWFTDIDFTDAAARRPGAGGDPARRRCPPRSKESTPTRTRPTA